MVNHSRTAGLAACAWCALVFCSCAPPAPPPASSTVNLSPGALAIPQSSLDLGATMTVTMPVGNAGSAAAAAGATIEIHASATSTFAPETDPVVGTSVLAGPVAVGESAPGSVQVGTTGLAAGAAVYLYAEVDPAAADTESDDTDNVSSLSSSAVVLIYDSTDSGRTYPVVVETYAPAGTWVLDTILALYKQTGADSAQCLGADHNASKGGYAQLDETSTPLAPGKYFALVACWGGESGPYVAVLRTPSIDRGGGAALTSDAADVGEPDNAPHIFPVGVGTDLTSLPATSTELRFGAASSRYIVDGDYDWLTFTLP